MQGLRSFWKQEFSKPRLFTKTSITQQMPFQRINKGESLPRIGHPPATIRNNQLQGDICSVTFAADKEMKKKKKQV